MHIICKSEEEPDELVSYTNGLGWGYWSSLIGQQFPLAFDGNDLGTFTGLDLRAYESPDFVGGIGDAFQTPEPTILYMLTLGGLALIQRRRR